MGGKTAIATGLVMGIVVGGALVGGVILLAPGLDPLEPAPTPAATSAGVAPTASSIPSVSSPAAASPSATASVPASASPAGSRSAGSSPAGGSPAAASDGPFGVGRPAPVLHVPRVGGGELDLASLRGKPVWVNFMGSSCPPCQDELPLMAGFADRYAGTGLQVLAIDVKEDEPTVAAFMAMLGARFPAGLGTDGAAQAAWKAIDLPVHFWVDTDGIVRYGAQGGIGPDVMATGLQTILPGVTVTP